jgi:glycosyltransferase involved in cell wall biosynthesis
MDSPANGRSLVASDAERIILDISSIARWRGPAVGILRVEQALARYALAHRPDVVLSFYDKQRASFRAVNPRWAAHLVSWLGAVGRRRGWLASMLPSPYWIVGVLEPWRLASGDGAIARGIERLQQFVLLARRTRRRSIVPFSLAIGRPLILGPRDVILSVGSDWTHKNAADIAVLKKRCGFRYIALCHDVIPLLFPQHFPADDVAAFRRYWTEMFQTADRVLVTSTRAAGDIENFCRDNGIAHAEFRRVPLGYDSALSATTAPLPNGLEAGRFILFVSTIEPRKGHDLLLRLWQRLLAANVPQSQGFKLVFVGRPGWQVDSVLNQIDDRSRFSGTLLHLTGIGDDALASLYHGAAFCVYPSQYEGLGLPIIEAFSLGKAVIASTGGALPETVGGFSPCLDLGDDNTWFETLKTWIEQPDVRERYEAKIRADFSWPNWDEAAAQIFAAVRDGGERNGLTQGASVTS